MRREFDRNTPPDQRWRQGLVGAGHQIDRQIRCNRQIQPGNVFNRRLRIALQIGC